MIVFEFKLKGKKEQYLILDEMIRTANSIRNKALRYWLDNKGTSKNDLQKLCAVLAVEYEWAKKLNSQARQASADRAWLAISRFYANCKAQKKGKKGFPKFKKKGRSVEYKTTGWKLSEDKKYLTLTDRFKAGKFKLIGTRDLHFYEENQIKRVRIVKRADGYYAQFCINIHRKEKHNPSGKAVGIDVGLEYFYPGLSSPEVVAARRKMGSSYGEIIDYLRPEWLVLRPFEIRSVEQKKLVYSMLHTSLLRSLMYRIK